MLPLDGFLFIETPSIENETHPFRWWRVDLGMAAVAVIVGVIYSSTLSGGVDGTKNITK